MARRRYYRHRDSRGRYAYSPLSGVGALLVLAVVLVVMGRTGIFLEQYGIWVAVGLGVIVLAVVITLIVRKRNNRQ